MCNCEVLKKCGDGNLEISRNPSRRKELNRTGWRIASSY